MAYSPKKIIIETDLRDNPVVRRVLERAHGAQTSYVDFAVQDPDEKETTLYLTKNPGRYFKPCPQTPEYVCCAYQILNFSTGCPIQCTYCILNGYFETRSMRFFCDHDRMFSELTAALQERTGFTRIGSGEFTDSLILDPLTDFTKSVVPFFLKQPNVLFEIKTKTNHVLNLLDFEANRRILVSWSVNPANLGSAEEKGSATLMERVEAASQCMKQGYLIGFHFDPILRHEGWEKNYSDVVDLIYRNIDPAAIAWISLGCFRFVPDLKEVIQRRFPGTKIIYEEFVQGRDGKMRYFRPLRERMYAHILDRIKRYHKDPPVYFCMETPLIWERLLGKRGFSSLGLAGLLDDYAKKARNGR
jgi:spore photoproduct lyase